MKIGFRVTMGAAAAALAMALTAPAGAGVIFFANDAAGFAGAMAGLTSLGTEDFEGSTLPPASIQGFNDPLAQGVANGPYPAGLTLPMTVQSNLSGGTPTNPNPRGAGGLAAVAAGSQGAASDVVVANTFVDSLDWIFSGSDSIAGVGFDTLSLAAGSTVEVRVYDTGNALLGSQTIAADSTGTNFLGIQGTAGDLIGRINIFSPGGGAEGGDNVELFSATTAVPEPATLALLGLGLAGLGFARRRMRG